MKVAFWLELLLLALAFTSTQQFSVTPGLRTLHPLFVSSQSAPNRRKRKMNKDMAPRQSSQVITETDQRLESMNAASKSSEEEEVPRTMPEAIRVFFFSPGPFLVCVALANLLASRITSLGPINSMDIFVLFATVVFWAFQEHWLHGKVLHSEFDWYGKEIHKKHHERAYHHISIDPAPLMLAWLGTAHLIFRWFLPLPLAVTATLGYASAGLFYEWAHFIVHTKVKPKSSFMKKMRDNHIRHHNLDERYWLAFSLPAIDDLLGTNPSVKTVRDEKAKARQIEALSR